MPLFSCQVVLHSDDLPALDYGRMSLPGSLTLPCCLPWGLFASVAPHPSRSKPGAIRQVIENKAPGVATAVLAAHIPERKRLILLAVRPVPPLHTCELHPRTGVIAGRARRASRRANPNPYSLPTPIRCPRPPLSSVVWPLDCPCTLSSVGWQTNCSDKSSPPVPIPPTYHTPTCGH